MSEWRTPSLYVEFGAQSLDGHAVIPATFYDAGRRLFDASIDAPLCRAGGLAPYRRASGV